jgi:hypothetical protein
MGPLKTPFIPKKNWFQQKEYAINAENGLETAVSANPREVKSQLAVTGKVKTQNATVAAGLSMSRLSEMQAGESGKALHRFSASASEESNLAPGEVMD